MPSAHNRYNNPMSDKENAFDPEGSGYDEKTASELRVLHPLTAPKPSSYVGDTVSTDSHEAWVWHPELKDYKRHGSSLDPRSGKVLKGRKHSTYHLTEKEETRRGSEIVKGKGGRYYARKFRGEGF